MRTLLLITGFLITLASCKSVEKMVDRGDYDGAIAFAADKLRGKENKKTKYVKGLERAFRKITAKDMSNYEKLLNENRPENWGRMHSILSRIATRQEVISPLLPLISNEGYAASFKFVKVNPLIVEAKNNASKYHYEFSKELLEAAREGDKDAARRAYTELGLINRYYTSYLDSRSLTDEALYLGTNRILLRFEDASFGFHASRFYDELAFSPAQLNTRWTEYYIAPPIDVAMDYEARVALVRADVSRGDENRRFFTDRKSVRDGFKYILDKKGNVKKDSLGNDITEPKFIDVEASIIEVYRHKEALVELGIEVIDLNRDVLIDRDRISHSVVFEDYSCNIRGDRRALSDNASRKYKERPLPFPSDTDMLMTAANEVRNDVRKKIKRSFI